MFSRKPIGETKASRQEAKIKAEAAAIMPTKEEKFKKLALISGGVLTILVIILGSVLFMSFSENRFLKLQNKAIKMKINELSKPTYNEVTDFILSQCGAGGAYCLSTQTTNPSVEMLKFLVNFREKPGQQYRLIFELNVGGEKANKDVLKCDGAYANFYICQEITSSSPTDVIRAFEQSYRSLKGEATYDFNLMVKPIGELEYAKPITLKAGN